MLNPIIENAYKVLDGGVLTREEALEIAEKIDGEDILDLVSLANKVRKKFAREIAPCSILNAKSGISNHAAAGIRDDPCLSKFGALRGSCPHPGRQFVGLLCVSLMAPLNKT